MEQWPSRGSILSLYVMLIGHLTSLTQPNQTITQGGIKSDHLMKGKCGWSLAQQKETYLWNNITYLGSKFNSLRF